MIANFLAIVGFLIYGFTLLGEYYSKGRWAKNITGLIAGLGMLLLALALLFTPRNAEIVLLVAHSDAANVLAWISSGLLLAAMASFGAITYWRPMRLWYERRIERDLNRELPRIP